MQKKKLSDSKRPGDEQEKNQWVRVIGQYGKNILSSCEIPVGMVEMQKIAFARKGIKFLRIEAVEMADEQGNRREIEHNAHISMLKVSIYDIDRLIENAEKIAKENFPTNETFERIYLNAYLDGLQKAQWTLEQLMKNNKKNRAKELEAVE